MMTQLIVARGESPDVTPTIHNYFLDGSAENAAQIDDGSSFASNLTYYVNNANETIAQVAPGNGSAHAVEVVTGGINSTDGVVIGDSTNAPLDPGAYLVGFDLATPDGATDIKVTIATPTDSALKAVSATATWQRVTVGIYVNEAAPVRVYVSQDVPFGDDPSATRIRVDNAMLTEGDPTTFADGASDGWAWSGTAHASVSSGPQPS